jgi:hypothetical protein
MIKAIEAIVDNVMPSPDQIRQRLDAIGKIREKSKELIGKEGIKTSTGDEIAVYGTNFIDNEHGEWGASLLIQIFKNGNGKTQPETEWNYFYKNRVEIERSTSVAPKREKKIANEKDLDELFKVLEGVKENK